MLPPVLWRQVPSILGNWFRTADLASCYSTFWAEINPWSCRPLETEKKDLRQLTEHLLEHYSRQAGKSVKGIDLDVYKSIMAYDWPGNVRELQNVLRRYVTLNHFDLSEMPLKREVAEKNQNIDPVIDFAPGIVSPQSTLPASVEAYEKQLILKVLEKNQWHRGKAAKDLGVHRRTLFKKIKKYRIDHS